MIIKVMTNNGEEDIFRSGINTENNPTTFDYISFISGVIDLCLKDIAPLEKNANFVGKTIQHWLSKSCGSMPLENVTQDFIDSGKQFAGGEGVRHDQ